MPQDSELQDNLPSTFVTESTERRLANTLASLRSGGHDPETVRVAVFADSVRPMGPDDRGFWLDAISGAQISPIRVVDGIGLACKPSCKACADIRSDVERDMEGVDLGWWNAGHASVFKGEPGTHDAWSGKNGVAMGEGIGGRVPRFGLEQDEIDEIDQIVDNAIGKRPLGRHIFANGTFMDELLRIYRGDYSQIPEHDLENCEWSFCRERACKNYNRSIHARVYNRVLDVAEWLKKKSPFLASAASARKISQAGVPLMEFMKAALEEAHSLFIPSSLGAPRGHEHELGHDREGVTEDPFASCGHAVGCFPGTLPRAPQLRPLRGRGVAPMYPSWSAPAPWEGSDDLMPVEDHLDSYYVGIFR